MPSIFSISLDSDRFIELDRGHTRQEDVEVLRTQSRISPRIQRILRIASPVMFLRILVYLVIYDSG